MFAKICLIDEETLAVLKEGSGKNGNMALFIDGKFQCSYHRNAMPDDVRLMESMLNRAIEYGKEARSAEILKLLGGS